MEEKIKKKMSRIKMLLFYILTCNRIKEILKSEINKSRIKLIKEKKKLKKDKRKKMINKKKIKKGKKIRQRI